MITARNEFHNTEARFSIRRDGTISDRTARRVRHDLFGCGGCICGGTIGERGDSSRGILAIEDERGDPVWIQCQTFDGDWVLGRSEV